MIFIWRFQTNLTIHQTILKKHQRRVGIFHRGADNSTHPKIMILAKVAALEFICQRRRKLDSLSPLYDTFDSKYLYLITFKLKYF